VKQGKERNEMPKTSCQQCGSSNHNDSYHVTKGLISDKGFPRNQKGYKTAHEEATKKEKKKYPRKDYEKLKHLDERIPDDKLVGKNDRRGNIRVSNKVPPKLRAEVAYHEKTENKKLREKKK
jgi:ribosomal protein L37E